MTSRIIFALVGLLAIKLCAALPPEYESLKASAEKHYADGSFAKAHELYAGVHVTNLPPAELRWVGFRLADTQWRSQAATQTADTTKLDQARQELEKLVRDVQRTEDQDRVWVEVQESLGDFWWTRRNQQNWGLAWQHYQPALDWWAGAVDIELARARYLNIIWRVAAPPGRDRNYYYGYHGNMLPLPLLENVLKISQTDNEKAHAHYLIAMTMRQQGGDWEQRARVPEHFETALKIGKTTEWYDDALYNYAEWMMNQGRVIPLKDGNWSAQSDFVKALELSRRLVKEFAKGETRYWEQAQELIKSITDPQLGLSVGNIFLPDSEIQYYLNWRNVKRIDLALYPVELNRDVQLSGEDERRNDWLRSIDLSKLEKIKSWTRDTNDKGDYVPGSNTRRYDGKLRPGAYVIEAKAGSLSVRDLILVTDAALVLKTSGKQALVYFCNALNSAPIASGKVKLWERWHDGRTWQAKQTEKPLNNEGIAVFDLSRPANNNLELFASAISDDRQAFSVGNSYWNRGESEPWKIYAFTDRPAYRPKETVQWKFIARRYNGSVYSTPSDATIEFEITDPRGVKVKADKAKLNTFGSAWGALELTEQMPLGEYRVQFWDEGRKHGIGNATLFRLEEYKLPEFKVSVKTPEENGQRKAFRLGEKVEVTIQADYYFGGAVANANVEVLVHQNPFWQTWHPRRDYEWFYEDMDAGGGRGRFGRNYGGGQIIKRETLKTDTTGKATLTFDTPRDQGDLDYRIEARVTDASRREILGSGNVRVTRQRYYVYAQPEHNLYKPQDKARVEFKALDANEQPVQAEGTVKVTRDYWWEIWLDPAGKEVKGDELKALQSKGAFPPVSKPGESPWRIKFRGYQHDDILTQPLKTDTNGVAELSFTPEREGYYRVAWLSEDIVANRPPQPIRAETTIWVANNATTELGYRHGSVQIIADKETFRVGQRAPVMLVTPTNDRYVLFSVEGEDLYSYQLVHVTGTVKLVELDIAEKHVPNIFLSAALVHDRQILIDTKQVVVPPTKNFLTVDVKPDRAQYQPREDGTFTVTTRDHEGKPVPAEVAFSLVDESVFYIQSDYAGDPRQFFYGTKRGHQIQTQSTMNQKRYAKLIEWENEQLIDERDKERLERQRSQAGLRGENELLDRDGFYDERRKDSYGLARGSGGAGGGAGGAIAMDSAAPAVATSLNGARVAAKAMTSEVSVTRRLNFEGKDLPGSQQAPGEEPAVTVRSDFRSTILWQPDVATDKNGQATVKVKYPDSLTGWKATARVASSGNQFGIADANTRTKQPLIVRLQAPRFFVVGDTVTISAVVNNNTEAAIAVNLSLDVAQASLPASSGSILLPVSTNARQDAAQPAGWKPALLRIPANGEARADWITMVKQPGEVKLKVSGRGGKYSDAMEKTYVAYEHGIEKFISKSGKVRGNDITVKLDLPKERKPDSTSLIVQVTPSMAVTMLDALPYLIDYPYGCTEQTMSRFLPAAITAKTLRDLGLQPEDVMSRVFGGIETNSAATTQPKGKKDLQKLDEMVEAGLERLYDFQHADGGWGWWKEGQSDHWMTAYVVWGLTLARDARPTTIDPATGLPSRRSKGAIDPATGLPIMTHDPVTGLPVPVSANQASGIAINQEALLRGLLYLDNSLVTEEENYDLQAFMLHALASDRPNSLPKAATQFQAKAFDNLWKNREKLNAYTRALLALSAHYFGKTDQAKTLIANLENGVKRDERPDQSVLIDGKNSQHSTSNIQHSIMGTAHWGEDGVYWRWSDGGVEATAFALRALLTIDPKNKLVEPVTNWLIKNRRGAQWSNTRDTAIVVLAMNDYLRVSGELKPEMEYELFVNSKSIAKKKFSGADVFNAPSRFTIDPKLIKDANEIRIKTKTVGRASPRAEDGKARQEPRPTSEDAPALYFSVEGKFFSLEEPITPAGNEIFVKREYYKLVGRPTLLKGYVYEKVPLADGESVKSGERVETVLTIEAKNNYEYLVFEDLKPAGIEAVEIRSGESLYARELKSGAVERKHGQAGTSGQAAAHTVKSGDTLSQIAQRSGSSVSAIKNANRLTADRIRVGQKLIIPPKGATESSEDYTDRSRWVYQELRDRKVALFLDKLPEGVWEIRYDFRAEVPGQFHALPVLGHAMYVPEIRCNGAEVRVKVEDAKP